MASLANVLFAQNRLRIVFVTLLTVLAVSSGCSMSRGPGTADARGASYGGAGGGAGGGSGGTPKGVAVKKGAVGTKPYTIKGTTYHPLLSSHGFREEGIASWYGSDFHGKKTANGERYDMHGMTAAHKLLPFGTQVRVTNKNNGKSIVVRINDRGPFVANRVIDLTKTGAERIGMIGAGTAPVILQTQGSVAGLKDGDLAGAFFVQVGAFASETNARNLAAKITRESGKDARVTFAEDLALWRVQAGPFASLHAAEREADAMQAEFPGNFVVAK